MKTKNIFIVITLLILLAGVGLYVSDKNSKQIYNPAENTTDQNNTDGKLKAETFSGKLEEVNTGCFADAECYVVVDGKHVTTTIGWSRDTVGSIIGVPGFGDLEGYIGKEVEVYAQDKGDGTYTLYGSTGFYVKLK